MLASFRQYIARHWRLLLALTLLAVVAVAVLRWEGRPWWCACGNVKFWVANAWSSHTSQHAFDPYSLTHLLHGMVFCGVLWLWFRDAHRGWQFVAALVIEVGWEILENSYFIIDRYRTATAALGYSGDTVVNSLGDIVSCAVGFLVARKLGWWKSVLLFVAIEVILLVCIRDNLLLNVIMLICPIDAVQQWQLAP
jgi:hypothetical protein